MRWACEPDLAYPANLVSQFKDANLDQLGDGQVFESLGLHAFDEVRSDFEDAPPPAFSGPASISINAVANAHFLTSDKSLM
jgi:hypothetical protein